MRACQQLHSDGTILQPVYHAGGQKLAPSPQMAEFLDSDPIEWGVEDVVDFLCSPTSAPWALSVTSPRPDPAALAAALRDNEIAGEALLYDVDPQAIKDDLGVKALGHRSSLNRAIEWLRARSLKYQRSKTNAALPKTESAESPQLKIGSSESPLKNALQHQLKTNRAASLETNTTEPVKQPNQSASLLPVQPLHGKRKIAPTLLSGLTEQSSLRHDLQNGISSSNQQSSTIPVLAHGKLSGGSQRGQHSQVLPSESDQPQTDERYDGPRSVTPPVWAKIFAKYELLDADDEVLPPFGDSGSEASLDSETWAEITPDHKPVNQGPDAAQLTGEDVVSIVSQYIADQEELWKNERLPKHLPIARYLWEEAQRNAAVKSDCSDRLRHLVSRLDGQQRAIQGIDYRSRIKIEKSCAAMDTTISEICFQRWRLNVLTSAMCPPVVETPRKAPQPRKKPLDPVDSDDDRSVDLGSDTEFPSDSDDLTDFVISDSEEQSSRRQRKDLGESNRRQSHSPPHKRPRLAEDEDTQGVDIRAGLSLVPSEPEDGLEIIDLTGMSPASTSFPRIPDRTSAQEPEDADVLEIQTPPLNPTPSFPINDSKMDWGLSPGSPPMDTVLETRISSPSALPPLDSINEYLQAQPGEQCLLALRRASASKKTLPAKNEDIETVIEASNMSVEEIVESQNRVQLLAKNILGLSADELQSYPRRLSEFMDDTYRDLIEEALRAMVLNELEPRNNEMDSGKNEFAMRIGALFLSWHHCIVLDTDRGMETKYITAGIRAIQRDTDDMLATFLRKFKELLPAAKVLILNPPEKHSVNVDREDFNSRPRVSSKIPGRNGSKKKPTTRILSTQQNEAQKRLDRQEKARADLERKTEKRGLSRHDPAGQAVTFKEPKIYLHPDLGKFVKPHQLLGIQFMWRELIDATDSQGCLLAHVMGLGKTFQVICLLVTIASAAASDDIKIRNQIPRKFHRSQTLVLCPSGVIENWIDEFAIWTPSDHKLGEIRDIIPRAQQDEIFERLERIKHWNSNGGVLIMSYEMLRSLINYKPTRASRALSIEQQELLSECLLSGPNIIVADEAHKLKGEKSAISQIASRFKTTNRIAMTGSPLANHLSEYYQMVEWISPGYLENPQSFKTKFMEPIQAGSYIDSTTAEQRESLCALQVLGGILNPKIHRADTSAIASDLPSKTEFVIVVPLTELQQRAYDTFVTCLKTSHESDIATKLWSWLALLQLCCNHPVPFREKLAGRSNQSGGDSEEALDGDSSVSVLPGSIKDAGLPSGLFPKIEALFKNIPEPLGPEFSHRSTLLNQILNEAADVGDKVLVFSQSIPTMDYLDKLLTRSGRKFLRLDGKTPSSQRQSLCKQFNTSDAEQVFLISTRAGGLGLNITGANRVVIFDFLFNPTWEDQAIGRAYRLGQKKPVFVYRFIAGGTFEDNVFNMAVYKRQLAVRVVDKINTIREAEKKTVEYLNPVRQVEREDHDAILGKDPQVLDKILAGSFGRIALRVTLSHIKDNESDTLDGTEQKRVADELYMEQLKRSSRPAYEAELQRRQAMLAAELRKKDEELKRPFYQMTQNWQHRESAIPMSFESDVAATGALQVVPYMPTAMGLLQQGTRVAPMSPLGYLPSSASMYQHHPTKPQVPAVTLANRQVQASSPGSVFRNPSLQSERRLEAATAKSVTPLTCPISRVPAAATPQHLRPLDGHLDPRFPGNGLPANDDPKPYNPEAPDPAIPAPLAGSPTPIQPLHAADIAVPEPSPSSLSEPMEISSDNDPYSPHLNSDSYSPPMEFGDHDAYSPPPA